MKFQNVLTFSRRDKLKFQKVQKNVIDDEKSRNILKKQIRIGTKKKPYGNF